MRNAAFIALGTLLALGACAKKTEEAAAPAAPAAAATGPNDYKQDANWLCRPGRHDSCDVDMNATIIAPDGSFTKTNWKRDDNAPVDCFYVYPTASGDTTPNSDMVPGDPGEISTVKRQAALLGANCRVFAPMYRSITLTALRGGTMDKADRNLGYNDVKDAWNDYLARDNNGRGVILFGHSQGAGVLKRLIAEEIDGKPIQQKIILAMPIGMPILVPEGKDVGGDFKSMPLCRKDGQTGCVIAYSTFKAGTGPVEGSQFAFGQSKTPGMQAACVNPAALGGGKAVLHPQFGTKSLHPSANPPKPWTADNKAIDTDYVQVPGLVSGECVKDGNKSYLAISMNADPKDPRVDDIDGDHYRDGKHLPEWGMHSLDVPVALGDLVARVTSATKAYLAKS